MDYRVTTLFMCACILILLTRCTPTNGTSKMMRNIDTAQIDYGTLRTGTKNTQRLDK